VPARGAPSSATPCVEVKDLLEHIKGPDFPTGVQNLNTKSGLRGIYEMGQGSVRMRDETQSPERGAWPSLI
jgi:DNA gyrase/topoisomerase IV subunit A